MQGMRTLSVHLLLGHWLFRPGALHFSFRQRFVIELESLFLNLAPCVVGCWREPKTPEIHTYLQGTILGIVVCPVFYAGAISFSATWLVELCARLYLGSGLKDPLVAWAGVCIKVFSEISVQTVMSEQYVRYLRIVRARYLLLGWW